MQYVEHLYKDTGEVSYCIYMNEEETDVHFDPFDPNDPNLASHLRNNRHRYIREETYNWLIQHVGEPPIAWRFTLTGSNRRMCYFESKDKAMLFKLTFG